MWARVCSSSFYYYLSRKTFILYSFLWYQIWTQLHVVRTLSNVNEVKGRINILTIQKTAWRPKDLNICTICMYVFYLECHKAATKQIQWWSEKGKKKIISGASELELGSFCFLCMNRTPDESKIMFNVIFVAKKIEGKKQKKNRLSFVC